MIKRIIIITILSIITLSFSKSTPHFIFDGIESYRECLGEKDLITFTIYGTLSENADLNSMKVDDYLIEDFGYFKCTLQENENQTNKNRKHKIYCQTNGIDQGNAYFLDEPKVSGFDFNNEKGETTWPKKPEKRLFFIGECGENVKNEDEPILMGNIGPYENPLNKVRKNVVNKALASLPKRSSVSRGRLCLAMQKLNSTFDLSEGEKAYLLYKWNSQNINYDCYGVHHKLTAKVQKGEDAYSTGKGTCAGMTGNLVSLSTCLNLEAKQIIGYTKKDDYVVKKVTVLHAWNVIKIDSKYYLSDPTWGAGSCSGDNYTRGLDDYHFCTNPEQFIREHLPRESKWQLVDQIIDYETFVKRVFLKPHFYINGFLGVDPDYYWLNSSSSFSVKITYDKTKNMKFIPYLYYLEAITENNTNTTKEVKL